MAKKLETIGKSSTGLDENMAGLLCYALGWLLGLVFLLLEKDSKFVKYHGLQSLIIFLGLTVVSMIVGRIPVINLLSPILGLAGFVAWIYTMVKAYQGEWTEIPYISDIVKKQLNL